MKVTIENHRSLLRLRWTCPKTGKRKVLSLGIEDSNTERSKAQKVERIITRICNYS